MELCLAPPWSPGHKGSATGRTPVAGGGRGCHGTGVCGDGSVLCCSSRRMGGLVPVEPVLSDLRARGQDQDAAV